MTGCFKGKDIHGRYYTLRDERQSWEMDLDINGYKPVHYSEKQWAEIKKKERLFLESLKNK